jgi:hypothetical protein
LWQVEDEISNSQVAHCWKVTIHGRNNQELQRSPRSIYRLLTSHK